MSEKPKPQNQSSPEISPSVSFVGAGPGDPELITVKGLKLLEQADVVIYTGSLVPQTLVENLKADTFNSASMHLDEVISLIKQRVDIHQHVVRLHTGDPAIYGAINEQMARLRQHNISFQVVPGVSSGLAAAASLQTELTLPEVSQTVIFTRRSGRTPVPEKEALPLLASHQATMMIFLSISMIDEVVEDLLAGGYPSSTPVAVIEKVSWPEERIIRAPLSKIATAVREAKITKTALIGVGEVLDQADPKVLSKLYDKHFGHGCRKAAEDQ